MKRTASTAGRIGLWLVSALPVAAAEPAEIVELASNLHLVHVPERPHTVMLVLTGPDGTAMAEGATLEEIQDRPLPERWADAWPSEPERRAMRLAMLHRALSESPASDEARLLELHRQGIEAHLERDVDKLMAAEAADAVVVSRGEISRPTLDERRAMFESYFSSTGFETYRDMVEPIVRVSEDGTLGWVIVQVEASGEQTTPSGEAREFEFQSAWIELYEKRDGEWLRVGNVSNFAPR